MTVEAERIKELNGCVGLQQIKKGFCFDPVYDALFAVGWPHIRLLTDVEVEPYKPALYHLMQTDFDLRLRWPKRLALALVRAWGIGRLYDIAPGVRKIREEVEETLWDESPMTPKEIGALIATRMDTTPLWVGDRATESFVLLAEALTSADVIAEAIVSSLEELDFDELADARPGPALITFQLGYLMLRMQPGVAKKFETRLRNILEGTAGFGPGHEQRLPQTPCHTRSIMLVLQGAVAAQVTTDHDLRWYTHSTDPNAIRMRASINRSFTLPDARLVWIGGPRILTSRFGSWHKKLGSTDQRWFLEQIGPIKALECVPLMLELGQESTVRAHARAWLEQHSRFAMPIIERLASVQNPHAKAAKAYLLSLE